MSQPLNHTPRADRIRIVIVGRRNAGKSSLINAIARQDVALVSPVAGTTTDPVFRSMEIHDLGPVVLVDTPGLDDVGELGQARVERARRSLRGADVVVVAVDGTLSVDAHADALERRLLADLRATGRRFVIVITKADVPAARGAADIGNATLHGAKADAIGDAGADSEQPPILAVSAATGAGIPELIAVLAAIGQQALASSDAPIVGDLLQPGDVCVLVTPIDAEAPVGRMILPQVQVLRDILDAHAVAVFSQPEQLPQTMAGLSAPPRLVITDSQVFGPVAAQLPSDQPLTSFSMLFARHKGDLDALTAGAAVVDRLRPGDPVLIAEACTHHPVADDIGRVKIPNWLRRKVGGDLDFAWTAGDSFPPDLSRFKLIIHCGGCMISRREMLTRVAEAQAAGVPIVNYGVLIAYLHGIMPRALRPLTDVSLTRTP